MSFDVFDNDGVLITRSYVDTSLDHPDADIVTHIQETIAHSEAEIVVTE